VITLDKIEFTILMAILFAACLVLIAGAGKFIAYESLVGADLQRLQEFKRDCEKSLPRDKVCVMVFDYVPVENDYE
jgi:hypothetical protein